MANGHSKPVEILVPSGTSILLADKDGRAPLAITAKSRHPTISRVLRTELKPPGYDL